MEKAENKSGQPDVDSLDRLIRRRLEPEYGVGEARAMSRLIFHNLKGWNATDLIVNGDSPASDWLQEQVERILNRLQSGEPLQYILGEARFYGMDLEVTPDVLIPRPETEELVDLIVSENNQRDLRVLDVGTGSGAIAIALSRNLPFARVTAIDVSKPALEVAERNAKMLHANIDFRLCDVFTYLPPKDSFDIIVSNPPYIADSEKKDMSRNVLEYEPHSALFVPDDNPLIYYSRIATIGLDALSSGGKLYFEINPLYATALRKMLATDGYEDVRIIRDISRRDRFAAAKIGVK